MPVNAPKKVLRTRGVFFGIKPNKFMQPAEPSRSLRNLARIGVKAREKIEHTIDRSASQVVSSVASAPRCAFAGILGEIGFACGGQW